MLGEMHVKLAPVSIKAGNVVICVDTNGRQHGGSRILNAMGGFVSTQITTFLP